MSVSALYSACRNGNVSTVERLLPEMSLDDIDRLEPNGSTALHAATFYGHGEIVRLLLEKGASRTILNKYNNKPVDEASQRHIQELFARSRSADGNERFVANSSELEWTYTISYPMYRNIQKQMNMSSSSSYRPIYDGYHLSDVVQAIQNAPELENIAGFQQVMNCMGKALDMNDSVYLLRAYTLESGFYKTLNMQLALEPGKSFQEYATNPMPIATETPSPWVSIFTIFICADKYRDNGWTGTCYRGMRITEGDLKNYRVGTNIVNKAFMSTSANRAVAQRFASLPVDGKLSALCKYKLTAVGFAIDLAPISEYPNEEEILIAPHTPFKVKKIKRQHNFIEIKLELNNL